MTKNQIKILACLMDRNRSMLIESDEDHTAQWVNYKPGPAITIKDVNFLIENGYIAKMNRVRQSHCWWYFRTQKTVDLFTGIPYSLNQ